MARISAALLAILAASAVHVVYAGIRPNGGLQYPGITGVIPACVCYPSPVLITSHQEHAMQSAFSALYGHGLLRRNRLLTSLITSSPKSLHSPPFT